uniref:Uncharacterized protein n=1 Tax=Candidatus Kentrum sp. LFY TaxID=2126342 RepID=A0A450WE81_9GAMM|nr:MAG: hypothetical protein BECKLFY1418C_GA0070996_101431 [Candidatus Kentron sp. LFY]
MDVIPAGGAAFQAALFGGGNQKTVGYRCSQRESIRAHGSLVEGWARPMVTDWMPLPSGATRRIPTMWCRGQRWGSKRSPQPNPDKPEPKHFDDAIVNPGTPLSSRPKGEIFRLGGHPEREGFLTRRKMTNHEFSCVLLEIFRVRDCGS